MRREEHVCELNALAQFKKFAVTRSHRGYITAEGIETVLRDEGIPDDVIKDYIKEFMTLDTNGDGKVSFLDVYESMMARIPDEWLEWLSLKFQSSLFITHLLFLLASFVALMMRY